MVDGPLNIVDYDPRWPQAFKRLRNAISAILGDLLVTVEHVGSTAVPGLAAKPITDMDAVVPEDRLQQAIQRLAAAGYVHQGDLGIPGREAFVSPRGSPAHHLYVCPAGSPELERHLRFRDYLRSTPTATAEYAALKRRLASESKDRSEYTAGKAELIARALGSAQR